MKRSVIATIVFGAVLFVASNASALPWTQRFVENGIGYFDEIAMFMKDGTVLFTGSSNYTNPSWTHVDTPLYISASGNPTKNMQFDVGFTDRTPFQFDFFAFSGGVIKDAAKAAYRNGWWSFETIQPIIAMDVYQRDMSAVNPVPEPATMILFGFGLAGLAAVRRKN